MRLNVFLVFHLFQGYGRFPPRAVPGRKAPATARGSRPALRLRLCCRCQQAKASIAEADRRALPCHLTLPHA